MASLRIQIINASSEFVSKGNGKGYNKLTVTYKNLATTPAKVEVKNIMDFASPEVYAKLKDVDKDVVLQVTSEKIGEYWQWTEVHRDDGPVPEAVATPKASAGAPAKTSTYEVNNMIQQERLKFDQEKQPLIVRQSSLSTAVEFYRAQGGKAFTLEDVLGAAARLEEWVNRKDPQTPEFEDIPL